MRVASEISAIDHFAVSTANAIHCYWSGRSYRVCVSKIKFVKFQSEAHPSKLSFRRLHFKKKTQFFWGVFLW